MSRSCPRHKQWEVGRGAEKKGLLPTEELINSQLAKVKRSLSETFAWGA